MGSSADATIFFGLVPTEADKYGTDFAKPWRFGERDHDCLDGDEALDIALGVDGEPWAVRSAAREVCPVEFLTTGDAYSESRYVLALKETVRRAYEWDVARFEMKQDWALRGYEMLATLNAWADRLGIPVERRGNPGWFLFATYD